MGALDGKVALVTGAARGQGRAHALAMAAEGANVVVCDLAGQVMTVPYPLGTAVELEETTRMIRELGARCVSDVVDIRDSVQVDSMVDLAISEFGRVDILVANAGICTFKAAHMITDQEWSEMVDTNLTGTFNCIRAALAPMKSQHYGRIVVVSSMSGRQGNPNLSHYSATKFGVIGLAKSVALEVAEIGITVNVMCPTSVNTPMLHNDANYKLFCPEIESPTLEDVKPRFAGLNPMRIPWIEPEVFTRAIMFLVTDPGFMTGSVLEVSAGISASKP